jgi:hypothetical protein
MKLRAGATARSRSSAWAASAVAKRTLQRGLLLPLRRPHSARPSGTGLTAPNIATTIVAETLRKIALRPFNVRVANTPRRRGSRSPCGSVVHTPPIAGQVPRDALRRRGVDKPAIIYERPCGFHEPRGCICLFLTSLFLGLYFFKFDLLTLYFLLSTRACVSNSAKESA